MLQTGQNQGFDFQKIIFELYIDFPKHMFKGNIDGYFSISLRQVRLFGGDKAECNQIVKSNCKTPTSILRYDVR